MCALVGFLCEIVILVHGHVQDTDMSVSDSCRRCVFELDVTVYSWGDDTLLDTM